MKHRVNYGDGQVSQAFFTKADAMKERAALEDPGCSFIEYQADGHWFSCGNGQGSYANTR